MKRKSTGKSKKVVLQQTERERLEKERERERGRATSERKRERERACVRNKCSRVSAEEGHSN